MRIGPAIGAGLAAALAIGLALPTYAAPDDISRVKLPAAASTRAEQALAHAQAMFAGDHPGNARASVNPSRDATLALRDLVRVRGQLRGTAAREADQLLARPAATHRSCTPRICVHWSDANVNQRDVIPGNGNGIPDYIDQVRDTVDDVHQQYVAAGYRAPRRDGDRGGNDKPDIYIRDVGSLGLYGFCTTDKRFRARGPFNSWAYCVLDNDYRRGQFPALDPIQNMQVTAAHEYFHAVQFAYDALEDSWFMEATATWAEDEIFDDINDNLQYLRRGPLRQPQVPLDKFVVGGTHQYGDWIFFRYLTERFPGTVGMSPLVRQMWQRADASPFGPDMYSLQAIRSTRAARGESFARLFAEFADANRRPAAVYDEGADNSYPRAPLSGSRLLGPGQSSGLITRELDHLTSATIQFTPTGLTSRLRITVDMSKAFHGALAVVSTYPVGGLPVSSRVALNRLGIGTLTVPFVQGTESRVEVTLVNASARTRCWARASSPFSCFGIPRDDNSPQVVRAVAVP